MTDVTAPTLSARARALLARHEWSGVEIQHAEPLATLRALADAHDAAVARAEQYKELLGDARGEDVEKRVRETIMAMHAALKERNADEGMLNLIGGFTHVAALAIAKGRWAVLEHEDAEQAKVERDAAVARADALAEAIRDAPHEHPASCSVKCICWKSRVAGVADTPHKETT